MRTTVTIDDELYESAKELTGIESQSELVRVAFKALVSRESARRLALLGGTQPHLRAAPRRRPE
ncbi:type II toxin-antitoxin system VapB family antitoxin [Hellea balneolensis]|uniref:type II toxin-antitoxin system VapB family antitoxin n=1 Tax=Hellea balneolensis TaxID=287478 RepID=UPI00041DC353|nr:type II toxin-antitoxin system VapB family antitoxin [Hellea balneolensis]